MPSAASPTGRATVNRDAQLAVDPLQDTLVVRRRVDDYRPGRGQMAAPQQEALALREGGRRDPAERVCTWRVRQADRTNRTAPRLLDLLAARVRGDLLPVHAAQPAGRTL